MAPTSGYYDGTHGDVIILYDDFTYTSGSTFRITSAVQENQWQRENESHKDRRKRLRAYMRSMAQIPTPEPLKSNSKLFVSFYKPIDRISTGLSPGQKAKDKRKKWLKAMKELK